LQRPLQRFATPHATFCNARFYASFILKVSFRKINQMTIPYDKKTFFTVLLIILFFLLVAYGIWLLYSYQLQRLEHHS
jgi:hypothetical protein